MVLAGLFVALVVIVFARLAYGMLLPAMRADLGMSYQQAGLLGTITALGYLALVLAGGVAAARWGAKQAVVLGLFVVAVGFTGLALATNYLVIMALMALLGFGTAFSFAPMISLLATWYPEKRGQVIGYMSAGIGLGLLITGALVPWLLDAFGAIGWRLAWGVFAMCWKRLRGEGAMRIGDVFQHFERVLTSIGLVFLGGLLVLLGFALLIIPGLYLSVVFLYALPLALDRRLGIWRALGMSRRLVHQTGFWTHALLLLSLVFPSFLLGGSSLGLLSLLWHAYAMAVVAVAYEGWIRPAADAAVA